MAKKTTKKAVEKTGIVGWVKNRTKERTTWDGAVCVALGLMIFSWHHSLRLKLV